MAQAHHLIKVKLTMRALIWVLPPLSNEPPVAAWTLAKALASHKATKAKRGDNMGGKAGATGMRRKEKKGKEK